jgi:hypothetical protein
MRRYNRIDLGSVPEGVRDPLEIVDRFLKEVEIQLRAFNPENLQDSSDTTLMGWDNNGVLKRVPVSSLPVGGMIDTGRTGIGVTDGIILGSQKMGSGLTTGNLMYFNGTTWEQADADAESTGSKMLGINLGSSNVLIFGLWATSGLTAGDIYYVSASAGEMTNVMPEGSGDIVRIIGYALSTTQFFFNPGTTYIELV